MDLRVISLMANFGSQFDCVSGGNYHVLLRAVRVHKALTKLGYRFYCSA